MQGCDMECRSPGIPAGRSLTVQWRNNVRRAVLRAGCLLGTAGIFTVLSIVLSAPLGPLAPGDTGGALVSSAQAAGNGQGDSGRGNNDGGGNGNGRGNDQGQDGDQDVSSDGQNDPAERGDDGQGDNDDQGSNGDRGDDGQDDTGDPSGDDRGDDGQGSNNDEGGDGADGAGVSTEGRGQAGGARAKGGSHGGERGSARDARAARGTRGGHGATESRPEFGNPGGIMDDEFEDRVATGRAEAVREALRATVLSADEEAAAIAAGWAPID